tara:strand:- start:304 stop:1179 length:876 start_codon:yes stop_codon:yes gene_type:complete
MSRISKQEILGDLKNLGIQKNDIIFVAADLLRTGYFNKSVDQTLVDWVDIFDELMGDEGTLIIPAYTNIFFRLAKNKKIVFGKDTPPNSGSLSKAFYKYGNCIRSSHPTSSCFGKGPMAESILKNHDAYSSCYYPYGKIIELGGKNLLLASVDRKNSPMAFHYAQEKLGHTLNHPYSKLFQTYYYDDNGDIKLFTRKDTGGCTAGVYKTWGHHISENACRFGLVGKGMSAYVDARMSFEILTEILKTNPKLIKCDDRYCTSCYGRTVYNGFGVTTFYPRKIAKKLLESFQS